MFLLLNEKQTKNMIECGRILAQIMNLALKMIRPGVSTGQIDRFIEGEMKKHEAVPSFRNYKVGGDPYPNSSCISLNADLVHGLPSNEDLLKEGDIVSIDIGAYWGGVHTDMARTMAVGKVSEESEKLLSVTKKCLEIGIKNAKLGNNIGQIGKMIEMTAKKNGLAVIVDLVGHGIGTKLHVEPQIPNYGDGALGPTIKNGMALAIEPMLSLGSNKIKTKEDGWTITMKDGSNCAHFEDTVLISNGKTIITTR